MLRRTACFALMCAATAAFAQTPASAPDNAAAPAASAPAIAGSATPGPAAEQLIVIDTKLGTGAEAKAGNTVDVHYTGWLYKPLAKAQHGRKFDSSVDRGEPLNFPLGAGRVIKGWDQGVQGMKVGGKRTLIIPSELAYGAKGAGGMIPPNAALIFDVELVGVK